MVLVGFQWMRVDVFWCAREGGETSIVLNI